MKLGPAKYVQATGLKDKDGKPGRTERLCLVLELNEDGDTAAVQVYNRPNIDVMVNGERPIEVLYRVPMAYREGAGGWLEPLDQNETNRHGVDAALGLGHGEARSRRTAAR